MLMTCNSKKRNNKMDELIPIGQIKSVFFNFAVMLDIAARGILFSAIACHHNNQRPPVKKTNEKSLEFLAHKDVLSVY